MNPEAVMILFIIFVIVMLIIMDKKEKE